jgi:predicted acylesterase/phospholipase RssA
MRLVGDIAALRRLHENQAALHCGQKLPHKILLVSSGGGMSCIRVPAYLAALHDVGITDAIDHFISVSGSGGGVGAYLSGYPHRATRMFEALAVSGFITRQRTVTPSMRLSKLGDALRGKHSPIALDQLKINASRSSWHVVATRLNGQSAIIDAKTAIPDTAQAVLASSAFPGLTQPIPLQLEGVEEHCVDGACSMPLPISAGIKRFRPDTVIVLESRQHLNLQSWLERCLWPCILPFMTRHLPVALRTGIASMDHLVAAEAAQLSRRKRIRWCRITPTTESAPVGPLTTDLGMLRLAAIEAKQFMAGQIEKLKPVVQI